MALRELIPWRNRTRIWELERDEHPVLSLHREMNRLFDDFFRGFEMAPFRSMGEQFGTFSPNIDVEETDKAIRVKVELPGMSEEDIEVNLTEDTLTIRGEKREDHEEEKSGRYLRECSYSSFYRAIPLPAEVVADKAKAKFRKGVLKVELPKAKPDESHTKKLPIETE